MFDNSKKNIPNIINSMYISKTNIAYLLIHMNIRINELIKHKRNFE